MKERQIPKPEEMKMGKYYIIEDGFGTRKKCLKELYSKMQQNMEEMRGLALKAGWSEEEANKFPVKIVKETD